MQVEERKLENKYVRDFTFSEPCIVIHTRENDQQDEHFCSFIYSN